jgi:pimeloyl-ACP methyl ester carboxylesterase
MMGKGACCSDGNCLCHGDVPMALTTAKGPYKTAQVNGSTGTIVYPTDAEPPFAGIAICPGFLNTGPEMAAWGPFYASWGIVTVVTNTGAADIPDIRAALLLGAIDELKKLNTDSKSPLSGKLSGRYGTSGYSMGGGGTTIAASQTASLNSSIGLAAWGGSGNGTKVPTLLLCGDADTVAPCNMSTPVYSAIPMETPKMLIVVPGATHFNWFGPTDTSGQLSGKYALAFQKVYLEGDTRWKALLTQKPSGGGSMMTNIQ